MANISIGERLTGPANPTYVIAEMACAHEGNPKLAHSLVDVAADASVNAVQFQLFRADQLISPDHPGYPGSKRLEIPPEVWPEIMQHAKERKLDLWATVFDETSLVIAANCEVDGYKIHSSDLSNPRLIDTVAEHERPIALATGGSTMEEISWAVERLRERGVDQIVLMHGYQGFPTVPRDAHLRFISTLRHLFGCVVGYQDHTDGGSELAFILPLVAIAAGAEVLEKHYTDDPTRRGTDCESALDPEGLARFVKLVRNVDDALGSTAVRSMSVEEQAYRRKMKKSIVAARDIHPGERISADMLTFMRSTPGIAPKDVDLVLGKVAICDIQRYSSLTLKYVRDA